ncbi:energy transducer TonB [Stakelama tenebrarum]|uniref:Energy transducer TonB n=1 Tax=Stakelama tenebrarum TaxID=2711215 RepID=A0A6G6Y571_9SPHN|nr:energy transducer TonB [Sphingosinithalassobacter tenebrarum]QIG80065.1 energy transducer TonB [Sphingosinithalassobacter tenebrarum]
MSPDGKGPEVEEQGAFTGQGPVLQWTVLSVIALLLLFLAYAAVTFAIRTLPDIVASVQARHKAEPVSGAPVRREQVETLTEALQPPAAPARLRSGYIGNADYPVEARRHGEEGVVRIRFVIGTDGRVGDCRIAVSSGSDALDAASCRLIAERFAYDPARDSEGKPVREIRHQTIRWEIDDAE